MVADANKHCKMDLPNLIVQKDSSKSYSAVWVLSRPKNFGACKQLMRAQLEYRDLFEQVLKPFDELKGDKKKDVEALLLLKQAIAPAELEKTGLCLTAYELWKKVQENYEGSKAALVGTVSAEWATLNKRTGDDLFTSCGRFETLLAKMEAVDYKVPDDQKFHFFVRNLHGTLREFAHTWKMCNPNGRIDSLLSAVKARHHTDVLMQEGPERNLYTSSNQSKSKNHGANKNEPAAQGQSTGQHGKPSNKTGSGQKGQQRAGNSSKLTCNHCCQPGHKWRDCKKLASEMMEKAGFRTSKTEGGPDTRSRDTSSFDKREHLFMVRESEPQVANDQEWVADSGSTRHITPDHSCLVNFVRYDVPSKLHTGGSPRLAWGEGDFEFVADNQTCVLAEVLYVPGFPVRIMSLVQVASSDNMVQIIGSEIRIHGNSGLDLVGTSRDGLMVLNLQPKQSSQSTILDERMYGASMKEWHARFAHLSPDRVNKLLKNQMVRKLDVTNQNTDPCLDCLIGKACRVSHPSKQTKTSDKHAVLHFDICGPMKTASIHGYRYLVVCVEERSNYRFCRGVARKSEVAIVVRELVNTVTLESGKEVLSIHTDNGGEFISTELRGWLADEGVSHTFSTPYTPQQNGVAERAIRAITEGARTQLLSSKLPMTLWELSCQTTTYALNRSPSPKDETKTRYELYLGVKPDVSNPRVFGQVAFCRFEDPRINKWGPRGELLRFVSYTERSNTYLFYNDSTGSLLKTCNARFIPIDFSEKEIVNLLKDALSNADPDPDLVNLPMPDVINTTSRGREPLNKSMDAPFTDHELINLSTPKDQIHSSPEGRIAGTDMQIATSPAATDYEDADSLSDIYDYLPNETIGNLVEIEGDEHGPPTLNDAIHIEIRESRNVEAGPARRVTRALAGLVPVFRHQELVKESRGSCPAEAQNLFTIEEEPATYQQALSSSERDKWQAAIEEELDSLQANRTWTITDKPSGAKTVKARWVFKLKRGTDGEVVRYKARLVAKGYTQRPGVDFHETFAPVASLMLVRLLVALACRRGMLLFQLDIKSAFLNGNLDEEIYLEPPEGFEIPKGKVLHLRKSLYGLRQAPRQWNQRLNDILTSGNCGLVKSIFDDCLYHNQALSLVVLVYVDDILVATSEKKLYSMLVKMLCAHVTVTESDGAFLGLNIDYNRELGTAIITQRSFIVDLLDTYGMMQCNRAQTPEEMQFYYDAQPLPEKAIEYKRLLGSLNYLALCTRPDISHAVGVASRAAVPTAAHIALMKRILRYLETTTDLGIKFKVDLNTRLLAYSDADYANDLPSRRSTTGYCVLYGGPVQWRSTRQELVAMSSTEAEYIAGSKLARELLPIKNIAEELGMHKNAVEVFIDNTSAIKMSTDLISRQRTKHIDVRARWLSEQVDKDNVIVSHVKGEDNIADLLTKPLAAPRFNRLRALLLNMAVLCVLATTAAAASTYNFNKVDPVYYKPTSLLYATGQTDHTIAVVLANPCRTYFKDLLASQTVNEQLVISCESWYNDAANKAKPPCVLPREVESKKVLTNELNKRDTSGIDLDRDKG